MRVGPLGLGRIGASHAATLAARPGAGEPVVGDAGGGRAAAEPEAFLGAAHGETDSPCTVEDALAALYLAEAAELSRREVRPVRVAEAVL